MRLPAKVNPAGYFTGFPTSRDCECTFGSSGIISRMRNQNLLVRNCVICGFLACTFGSSAIRSQVLRFADLNTRDFAALNHDKTVVVIPGGILEEHGPYLPAGTDGIFNGRLAEDLC